MKEATVRAENEALHHRMGYWRERAGIYEAAINRIAGGCDIMQAIITLREEQAEQDTEYNSWL